MLKDIILQKLQQYIGKYVENIDPEKLNYSILKGIDAELTDLTLRPDAVVELLTTQLGQEVPVEVKAGHVDTIKFSFPWSNLFSANVQLVLDGLYVLLGPINDRPYEEKKDQDLENAIKQAKLRAFEQSTFKSVAEQAAKNPGFFEKFGKYILNNIQITIRNVHIRYEDSITNGDYSFAVGTMLQSFTVHTTNDRWEDSDTDSSATILHKLGSLTDLSVYWNHYVQEADLVGKKKRIQSHVWKNMLKQSIATNRIREESFTHILRPVTIKAKVIMNNEDNFMMPRIYVEFSLPDVMFYFSRHQYLNLLKWIDASRRVQINRRYRRYHPNTPVRFNRKAWWHYAYNAVVEERIRPRQWTRVVEHRKKVVRYGQLYKTHLEYPDNKTLQEDLKKLERDMDLCNIIVAREQAKLEFVSETPDRARKKMKERREREKANEGWFSWILGGSTEEPDVEIEINTEEDWLRSLSEEERSELYQGVGYDEDSQEDAMPKEYIAYKMQLRLKNVSLTLENYSKPILKMTLSDMLTSYENRPGGNGARVLSHTESFTIEGASVDYKLVSLLTSNSNIYSTDSQMFTLDYELRPLSIHADQSLKLNVRPVEIFYDQHAVSQILMFLQVPMDSPQVDINAIAREKLMDMVEYSRSTLLYAIEQQSTFHISVHMKSPYIVIPQKGTLHQGGNLLICDLGNFTVESDLLQKENVPLPNATISELQDHLYDKFLIKISDVKVLLADSEEEWDMAQKNPNSEFHILPSTGLDIAFYKRVLNNNQQPQQKFDAMLQSLTLTVTDVQIVTLNNFMQNFPVPTTSTSSIDALDVPPPPPDWRHIQIEMDAKQLRRARRTILSRLTIDLADPIQEESVTQTSHSTLDSAQPRHNRRSTEPDTDTYYSASDDSEDEMDKWSSYRKVKSVDDYITENNRMQMFMRASIGEIVIQVSLEQNKQRREYLMFRMDGFSADMAYTVWISKNKVIPCGIAFHARLRGIGMADKLHRGATGAYLDLLQTESENELISISYRQVKPGCPDFGPVFKNIEHGATLTFNNLSIMFDQTGVCYLKKFLEDLQARMYPKKDTLEDNPFVTQSFMSDSSAVRLRTDRGSRSSRASVTEKLKSIVTESGPSSHIKIHVITCVHDISLHLRNVETKFSELHIKGVESQFIARAKKMTFNCRLQKFFVKDLTPDTLYPNILEIGTDESPFFDLKVEQFKSDGMTRRMSRRSTEPLDYYARLHIGQLQVAFINKFFWEITRFFEPLKSPELSDAAYKTKESVSKQMKDITPATVRIALVVKAHIPTVVVPQHSQSRDLFFVKFGNLEVCNQFERKEVGDTGESQEWNHFNAKLTSMQISKGKLLEDNITFVVLHHLVEPVNFTASFSLALAPFVADIMYDISGELNLIKVNLLKTDMKLVMDIMKQNLGEGAPSTKPDLAKPSTMKPTSTMDSGVTVIQRDLDTPTDPPEVMPGTPYNAVVTLQGLVLCLYEETNGTTISIEKNFLSRFEVGKIKARANSHKEGENKLDFNLSFHTMSIDDMRPNNTRAVRNVFYCTREEVITDDDHKPLPMISVIYKTAHDGSQEADIRMEKITLNLNVPFLLRLREFYAASMGTSPDLPPPPLPSDFDLEESHVDSPNLPAPVTPLKVFCTIKEPEIVLFADPSLEDSRIVVLKADIEVDMLNNDKTQKLGAKVKDLKMYSAQFSTQQTVSSWVIQPCDLTFERTYNIQENHVDMSARITELVLCMSPNVLHFAFDVSALLGNKDSETPEDQTTSQKVEYRNLWEVKATSAEKWLDKIDDSGNNSVNPLVPQRLPSESLHLEIDQIHAYFQVRNLDRQVNLLLIRSSLDCQLHDWNKQFHMNAEMNLQVDYFNERLSVWEPLVEPVSEKEGIYRPWEVVIKVIRGRSYPMTFNYVQEGFNMEECLHNDVQQLLHNSRHRSSSSESETDESTEMTVLRPKMPRKRSRLTSDKSYESIKQGSIQGESDTEPDGLIHSITNKLGGIFSDDSSDDADVSETEDTDELHDPSLDKPVFLTPKGPVQVSMARRLHKAMKCHCLCPCLAKRRARSRYYEHAKQVESGLGFDQVDGRIEEEEEEALGPQCNYLVVASQDKLQLNVTPQAIHVLSDISQALTSPASLDFDCKDLPAFELHSKLGIQSTVALHQNIKLYEDNVTGCTVKRAGDELSELQIIPRISYNGVDEGIVDSAADGLLTRALGSVGHVLTSAGAFVFDDDDDYLSGEEMDQDRLRLQVDGFDLTSTILHRRACLQLIPLTPDKPKDSSDVIKHSIKYWFLLDIDVSHGRKVINILSPLKIKNSLTLDLDVLCKTTDLEKYLPERDDLGSKEYTKLTTLAPDQDYSVPLFLAYHCDLFVCPSQLSRYQIHNKGIYWKDLLMTKEKAKCFTCQGTGEVKSFNLKVLCKERTKLQPSQEIPKGVPYYVLHVKAPVMIHNYLPYDIQFSLEGTGNFSSLIHGESTPLYTVEQASPQKLHVQLQDYIGCDWTGIFEISQGLEEFKAVSMAPYDCATDDNSNKQLTIIVNAKEKLSLDLYFYSPYWVLNKTDLPIQIRGSGSDAVYDCCPSNVVPLLFRFKKTKRKKAKVRVYNSKWSQSFSMDTIGNSGVVICYDKERRRRYRMMLQCQWSSLKLTRIVTILPFFLVVNNSSHNLRYMEENEETDLWEDLKKDKCCPLWPRTTSEKMFIKYEDSGVVSEHIPFNTLHNTVLRMEHGSALCVEVSGGIEAPRTITFTDYDPGDAPVRVENLCDDVFITIHQINQHQMTVLPANRSILYTWDDPTGPRKLMWNVYGCSNKQDSEIDINKDGFYFKQLKIQLVQESGTYKYSPQQGRHHHDSSPEDDSDAVDHMYDSDIDTTTLLKTNSYKMKIYWISFLDGQQRVVLFTRDSRVADAARMAHVNDLCSPKHVGGPAPKMNEGEQASLLTMVSLDGLSLSVVTEAYEEVALVSVSSMPAMWQIEVKNKLKVLEDVTLVTWLEDKWIHGLSQASLEDRIEVDFVNMRMTKPYMGDLCRVCPPGMLFQYRRSEHQTFIHAKVHHIQVDNQLHDAYYQTVLHPAPIPLNMIKKKGPKPFIEFGMIRRCVPENNVDTFRQLQVIIQEFSVQLDWGFIESIQDTFADLVPKPESECVRLQCDLILAQKQLNDLAEVKDRSTKKMFFEMCKISPLKLHVSFSFRGIPHLTRDIQPNMTSDIKEFLRNSVGATFIEVKDVELKFGYFEKRGASLSWSQLTNQMTAHYRQQLILQVYVVVLGLDVLGNPYGLMQDISQGLGDLFYEPLLDTIQGDDEFSENMIRGFQSAMGHIVGGGANSLARITGTFGSALAYLSFDKEFQKKRRRRMQQQPADLPHSMAMAGKGFLTGIKYGLTGIVLDPYQGASEDGVEGFFKGIGRGILGLITQPIGGVLDMVSLAFDGVRRAAELEGGVVMRMRLPRCIDHYRGLKPYSEYRARGSHILKGIKGGKYSKTDAFRNFAPLSHEDKADLVFITNRHILYLEKSRFSGGYDVEWEVELKSILGVPGLIEDDKKLVIHLKDNTGSLFSDNNVEITSLEIDILKWIQKKLENVLANQIYKV